MTATDSGVPLEDLARQLMADVRAHSVEESRANAAGGVVPWSWRAAFLSGIIATCSQAGFLVAQAQHASALMPGVPIQIGGAGSITAPAVIGLSLLSGGQDAATSLMLSHFGLRFCQITSPVAYAIGGAAAGALSGYATRVLLGGEDAMTTDILTGLVAGFFYRLLAGVKPTQA